MLKFWGITGPKSAQSTLKWADAVSREIPRICRSDPRNLANSAAEFGKICRGKLWALIIMSKMGRSVIGKVVAAFVCAVYQFTGSVAETRLLQCPFTVLRGK